MATGSSDIYRTFIGLPIEESAQNQLDQWLRLRDQALRASGLELPKERQIPNGNRHITLHFLGNLSLQQRMTLQDQLHSLAPAVASFSLKFTQLQHFPDAKSPILAAICEATQPLQKLWQNSAQALQQANLEELISQRHFRPHVTLTRSKHKAHPSEKSLLESLPLSPIEVPVSSLCIYDSQLNQSGSRYTVVDSIPLKASESI